VTAGVHLARHTGRKGKADFLGDWEGVDVGAKHDRTSGMTPCQRVSGASWGDDGPLGQPKALQSLSDDEGRTGLFETEFGMLMQGSPDVDHVVEHRVDLTNQPFDVPIHVADRSR